MKGVNLFNFPSHDLYHRTMLFVLLLFPFLHSEIQENNWFGVSIFKREIAPSLFLIVTLAINSGLPCLDSRVNQRFLKLN